MICPCGLLLSVVSLLTSARVAASSPLCGLHLGCQIERHEDVTVASQSSPDKIYAGEDRWLASQDARLASLDEDQKTVILHIGKTGGSSVWSGLRAQLNWTQAKLLSHQETREVLAVCAANPDRRYTFFVRDPLQRYVSAWTESYRLGWPDHIRLWTFGELLAFLRFHSPDELACALSSDDPGKKQAARNAMNAIEHVRWSQVGYWGGLGNFRNCSDSIFFVGRTEHFSDDYAILLDELDSMGALLNSSMSRVAPEAHATPYKYYGWKYLGECAIRNLRTWYRNDYVYLEDLAELGFLSHQYVAQVALEPYPSYSPEFNLLYMSTTWFFLGFVSLLLFIFPASFVCIGYAYGWDAPSKCPFKMQLCIFIAICLFVVSCSANLIFLCLD